MNDGPLPTAFYTAGELAALFDTPRQTLLYYDRIKLLVPEYISENNYRHYSIRQYLTLEIILNLRKLGVPVKQIRRYLEERGEKNFRELLEARRRSCDEVIARARKDKETIEAAAAKLQKIKERALGVIALHREEEQLLHITDITAVSSPKERVTAYARHNNSKQRFKTEATGWLIDSDQYLQRRSLTAKAYYTVVREENGGLVPNGSRPAGLYLTVSLKGTFTGQGEALALELRDFIRAHELTVCGDVYVLPLKDHWLTLSPDEYTVEVSLPVRPKSDER